MSEIEAVFLMADLVGYTALTETHGGLEAAKVINRYVELAREAAAPGVRVIEQVADEVLFAATDAAEAVRTAVSLREAVEREPLFPMIRAGLHGGPVLQQGDRYFGTALNVTARVAGHARAGQILCTGPVARAAARLSALVACRPLGPVRLKNVREPVDLFEIVTASERSEAATVDPVCRMQVQADEAPARLPYGGVPYYFCSFECAKAFAEDPLRYHEES